MFSTIQRGLIAVAMFASSSAFALDSSKISLGVASDSHLLNQTETGISATFEIDYKSLIQAYLLVPSSDPSLHSIAAAYKYTVHGDRELGFHVGGGLGLGEYAEDLDFFHICGIIGFHFTVLRNVKVHVDSGLTVTNDDAPGDEDDDQTIISGHSSLFGLSLLYTFN